MTPCKQWMKFADFIKGGKDGDDLPPISAIFKRTKQKKSGNLDDDESAKYDEIVGVETENPTLSHFDVVEKCFGEQDRGSVVCFGYGVRPKHVRGPLQSRDDLIASVHEKERENANLRKRLDEVETKLQMESEMYDKKHNDLEAKFDMLMTAFMQRSHGSEQTDLNVD